MKMEQLTAIAYLRDDDGSLLPIYTPPSKPTETPTQQPQTSPGDTKEPPQKFQGLIPHIETAPRPPKKVSKPRDNHLHKRTPKLCTVCNRMRPLAITNPPTCRSCYGVSRKAEIREEIPPPGGTLCSRCGKAKDKFSTLHPKPLCHSCYNTVRAQKKRQEREEAAERPKTVEKLRTETPPNRLSRRCSTCSHEHQVSEEQYNAETFICPTCVLEAEAKED